MKSNWIKQLWPFQGFESKKLIPLLIMKFLVSINYCILTTLKDSLVVTAKGSGAEAIPVLKGWVVLPFSILLALGYSKLSNKLKNTTLFYTTLGFFSFLIFILGFFLYPNAASFVPEQSSQWLSDWLGPNHGHWVSVYRNWIPSLLFVIAELWGGMAIMVLFWGFANEVTSVSEAKKSYSLYIAAGDVGAMLIGPLVAFVAFQNQGGEIHEMVRTLLGIALLSCLCIAFLYAYLRNRVLKDPRFIQEISEKTPPKPPKAKIGLIQGIVELWRSKHLLGIAVLVIGYGLTVNLIEVVWKASLKELYPSPIDYQRFYASTMSWVGTLSFIISVFFGSRIFTRMGWRFSALITPVVVGGTGVLFLALASLHQSVHLSSLLVTVVLIGAVQNVMSKVAKYSFFDASKEMAYIPLDPASKVKGKAAVDVVGSRLGKSGSSWILIGLIDLVGLGSILSISHYIVPIVAMAVVCWIYSVYQLDRSLFAKDEEASKGEV